MNARTAAQATAAADIEDKVLLVLWEVQQLNRTVRKLFLHIAALRQERLAYARLEYVVAVLCCVYARRARSTDMDAPAL